MKLIPVKLSLLLFVTIGLFIGFIKGQDARNKWLNKKKNIQENKNPLQVKKAKKVILDDFEIATFHHN